MNSMLIIDDDDVSHFVISSTLEQLGIDVEIKSMMNGLEAATFFKSLESNYPDLVLLDINMPLMNGFDFLDWYEKSGFIGSTKIWMYSSSERAQDKERALTYKDVIGYIDKPMQVDKLTEILDKLK